MQVSAKETPAAGRWAQNLYLVLASLMALGIFLQGFFIGALLFSGATWGQNVHAFMGLVLLVVSLLLALVGLLAHIPGSLKIAGFVLFGLVLLQLILASLSESVPLLAALHPANAMILFGLSLFLIVRIRQVMRGQG